MASLIRRAKYALGAPVLNAALTAIPQLSRKAPPPAVINVSGSANEWATNGDGIVEHLMRAGLREGHTVIEPGMGIGGNAAALWRRFGDQIAYRGFDVVAFATTWSRQHFAGLGARNYEFTHADIHNSFYNPFGKLTASAYRFPYPDACADLVFTNSVFTHMQEVEVERYIRESARVLSPGGLASFTFFLLDDQSEAQLAAGRCAWSFDHSRGGARINDPDEPDRAVAYPLAWVERRLVAAGFKLRSIERSSWRGIPAPSFQDIILAERAS